jgi:hypothetical protein
MNPNPLVALNHFTTPVATSASRLMNSIKLCQASRSPQGAMRLERRRDDCLIKIGLKGSDIKSEHPSTKFSVVSVCSTEYCFSRPGGVGMTHYRAYLLDQNRHVISVANLQCANEQEARECAQQLVDGNDIELWQLDRRIAVFEGAIARDASQTAGPEDLTERSVRPSNEAEERNSPRWPRRK